MNEMRSPPTRCNDCPIREKALFQVVADRYLADAESRRTAQYSLAARATLYQEGAPPTMAYTLFSGWLMLYRNHSDGSRQGLRIALPGDFVGYMPVPISGYSHGAFAVTQAVVCAFRQHDLHAMMEDHVDLARHITSIQAHYIAACETSMLGLGRKSAKERIAYVVAELYHRLAARGEIDREGQLMPFPLTQEMLGELTGLTPVHTNRVLRKLRLDGFMTAERHRIHIPDVGRLCELADYEPPEAA